MKVQIMVEVSSLVENIRGYINQKTVDVLKNHQDRIKDMKVAVYEVFDGTHIAKKCCTAQIMTHCGRPILANYVCSDPQSAVELCLTKARILLDSKPFDQAA